MIRPALFAVLASLLVSTAALAGNSLISPGQKVGVAKSALMVVADREWNKMGARPGRYSESWTLDGNTLNDLTFYGGVESGRSLFREVDKRNRPLPHFSTTMLPTDIAALLENSYRIALGTTAISIDSVKPARFAGHKGVSFTYSFTLSGEEVQRKGEAHAAIVKSRLYMITFEAPRLHYFDAGVGAARAVVASAALP